MSLTSKLNFKTYIKDSKAKKIVLELFPSFQKICLDISNYFNLKENYLFALVFVTESKIKKINCLYGKPQTTDVLVFPFKIEHEIKLKRKYVELGDIFISLSFIEKNAKENDFFDEIKNVFIHGVLHLFGYNHEIDCDKEEMFFIQDHIFDLQKNI